MRALFRRSSRGGLLRRRSKHASVEPNGAVWFTAAVVYVVTLAWAMTNVSYDIWAAMVVGPVLAGATLPWLRRSVARDDPAMVRLISAALLAKLGGSVVRYVVTFGLYDEAVDALGYHGAGARIAEGYWGGQMGIALEQETPYLVGTPFIRVVTGCLYVVTGPTLLGGFVVFGFLSFLGLYFFYRALRVAFPEADHRRYAWLLFFLPTLLYWPSSIGKEAWMTFTLGVASYGVALVLRHRLAGYVYTGVGLLGTTMVRPHLTALMFGSLFFAYLMRRRSRRDSTLGPAGRVGGIAVLLVAGSLVMSQVAEYFDLDGVDSESVESLLEYTEGQSSQGGSEFASGRPTGPADYPGALMAVLFRPYLWEAGNPQMQVAAVEGLALLAVYVSSWRRLARVPATTLRVPYLACCLAFTVMFVFAFSSISNFGIMTRQRAQVFPFVLVLLAVPEAPAAVTRSGTRRSTTEGALR